MSIQRLEAEGFRSFREMAWEPGSLNVFIGPNTCGRSNLLRQLYRKQLRRECKKTTDGRVLFGKLNPETVLHKCPYIRALLDSLLDLAQSAGKWAEKNGDTESAWTSFGDSATLPRFEFPRSRAGRNARPVNSRRRAGEETETYTSHLTKAMD